jgi:hypothetical protein
MTKLTLVPGKFCIDDTGPFDGYYDPNVYWNGWRCPYFTKEVALKVLEAFYQPYNIRYDKDKNIFSTLDMNDCDEGVEYWDEWESVSVTVNGKKMVLYPIGAFAWIWDLDE